MKHTDTKCSVSQAPLLLPVSLTRLCILAMLLVALMTPIAAQEESAELDTPQPSRDAAQVRDPMDLTGVDSGVASILRNHYRHNYQSSETWERVQSLRFEGMLHLKERSLRFVAFKKKPNNVKIMVSSDERPVMVMAYDGADAWQIDPTRSAEPVDMPAAEALNFIRDAVTGSHLLNTGMPGKRIELQGSTVVDGRRHYELLVTLPTGQTLTSLLDMVTFSEYLKITQNAVTGDRETVKTLESKMVEGIHIPTRSELSIDGKVVHTIEITDVRINVGVMSWMFARSSGMDSPRNGRWANSAEQPSAQPLGLESVGPRIPTFPNASSFSPFAKPSVFDIPAPEMKSFFEELESAPVDIGDEFKP